MKKIIATFLSMALVVSLLAACGSTAPGNDTKATDAATEVVTEAAGTDAATEEATEAATDEATEPAGGAVSGDLVVFAAASMTETLTKVGEMFTEANPDVNISFNFDSSGTLYTQIVEGADCDVFISAAPKQMNQLDITADKEVNKDGNDYVVADTRINLLENKVVLAVPEGNAAGVESFDGLIDSLKAGEIKLAIGNSDVPVGQYTQKIFKYYEIELDEATGEPTDDTIKGCITYGTNVKEVTSQVTEAAVDCGIVYATDAFSAGLEHVDEATKDMCGQVIYPAAVLNITKNEDAARAFMDFIVTPEASAVFMSVGFTALN